MKTRNKILLATAIYLLVFSIAMIVIFCCKGSVPDTLITYTLGVGGVVDVMTTVVACKSFKEERSNEII